MVPPKACAHAACRPSSDASGVLGGRKSESAPPSPVLLPALAIVVIKSLLSWIAEVRWSRMVPTRIGHGSAGSAVVKWRQYCAQAGT